MVLTLGAVWRVVTPVTIVSVFINIIPFVIHLRLGNWPGLFLTVLFVIYGILVGVNGIINRTTSVAQILLLPKVYWFCSIYDIAFPIIKVATSGCCLRLLTHLMIILQKTEVAQQTYTQHHCSTATFLTNISGALPTLLPPSSVILITNRQGTWNKRMSDVLNRISLWYQDYRERIWDVLFIWIFPVLYMISIVIFDVRFNENDTYHAPIRYLDYSPMAGCLPNKYEGILASTIYYIYPLILVGAGVFYTALIGIKIFKLRHIFSSVTVGRRINKPTFYRLYVFCCLYNILYLIHIPNTVYSYLTVILGKAIVRSEQDIMSSKNGLILVTHGKLEIFVLVVYPLLSFIWMIFFGTTKEAYDIYALMWQRVWHHLVDRQQQQENHTGESYTDPLLNPTTLASSSPSTSSLPPMVSTLISSEKPLMKEYIKLPPPASLSSQPSSLWQITAFPLYSTNRHTFSSIPSLPERPNLLSRHSIHSATGTVSSRTTDSSATTLVNPS